MNEGRRPERIAELVLRELSALIVRELRDPRLRGVTLTRVVVTDDLRHCRVFFSHLEGRQFRVQKPSAQRSVARHSNP